MEYYNCGWEEFLQLINVSAAQIKTKHPDIDTIVCLSRGGLIGASLVSHLLEIKRVYSFGINYYSSGNKIRKVPNIYQPLPDTFYSENILIVDDITDSGKSLHHVLNYIDCRCGLNIELVSYTTFYKPKSIVKPDFYSEQIDNNIWVNFPFNKP